MAACGRGESVDLTAQLPLAEAWHETARIDFGTPAARPHLLAGWSRDEIWNDDQTMVWSQGEHSLLAFYAAESRSLFLNMQCSPLAVPDAPPQQMELAVNGLRLGRLELLPGQGVYRVFVPATAVRVGVNTLELRYAHARRPINLAPDSRDNRRLSVAWNWIMFEGLRDGAPPSASAEPQGGTLTLPVGSEVSFFADLGEEGATLRFDAVRPLVAAAGSAPRLEVSVERDGQVGLPTALQASRTPAPWSVSIDGAGPVRIRLRVPGAPGGPDGVVIAAPRLLLPHDAPARCRSARPPASTATPVILYVIDTLRADHLGCYGYDRATSPRLDAFAADAVRFDHAVAQASWTRPSVSSIMTGLTPPRHTTTGLHSVLPPLPTLASRLGEAGYQRAGFVTNGILGRDLGHDQGFETYEILDEELIAPELGPRPDDCIQRTAAELRAAAVRWLDARHDARPLFLYLHASDPHNPYLPPSPFREALAADADPELGLPAVMQDIVYGRRAVAEEEHRQLIELYDADIASMDAAFGALVDDLRARGVYDEALIVVVADHGEGFGEHGYYEHVRSLYAELLHVPLLIKFPRQWRAGTVVRAPAQQVDILPTVLDVLGIDPPPDLSGSSLLPAIGCPEMPRPPIYSAVGGPDVFSDIESLVVGRYKLIHSIDTEEAQPSLQLYDIVADPAERTDLAPAQPIRAATLFTRMPAYRTAAAVAPARTVLPEGALRERMRALGYLP